VSVPKRRTSHSRTRMRRSHDALKPIHLTSCPRCHQTLRPHTVCGNCGTYRDQPVIDVEAEQGD
jgi:large subunit ribosomal protein L32